MIVNSEGLKNQVVLGSSPRWRIWFGLASTPPLSVIVSSVNMDLALKLPSAFDCRPKWKSQPKGVREPMICGLVENAI